MLLETYELTKCQILSGGAGSMSLKLPSAKFQSPHSKSTAAGALTSWLKYL